MIIPLQQQVVKFWTNQKKPQRYTLVALILAGMILVPALIIWASTPTYTVAFNGLSETDAGTIVQKLDDAKIPYKLRDTGTILVPSNQVYAVRLQIARQGLPATGTVGFELFSGNTLGMTEFTQKVNYQRALEGELARTIASLDAVESVNVHIVTPEKTLLADQQSPTTASITLKEKAGYTLDQAQVISIVHLVASSVEGLKPEDVVVVDTDGNMLASGSEGQNTGAAAVTQSDNQRAAELTASANIQKKVQTLLDSVLGPNKSVVKANVIMDWTQREVTSQTFDPTPAAVRSVQKSSETYTTNGGATGGIPGSGSNLPTPVPTVAAGSGATNYQRTDETTNYELSQTQSKEVYTPGEVKRITLSVLVDGMTDQAQLTKVKDAVGAAAGIDTARGDVLAVDTMAFDRSYVTRQETDLTAQKRTDLYIKIGEIAAAVLALVAMLWFVQRLFKNLRMAANVSWTTVMKPVGELALNRPGMSAQMAMIGAGSNEDKEASSTEPAPKSAVEEQLAKAMNQTAAANQEDDQRQQVITKLANENPASVAEIIQLWLNQDEKKNG